MNADLDFIVKAIELARIRLASLKGGLAANPAKLNAVEDAELAIGWTLKKLEKLREPPPETTPLA